jgi:lipoprotein-anchoring transpeptidase ErfK/SrfK
MERRPMARVAVLATALVVLALGGAGVSTAAEAPCGAGPEACVDLSEQKAWLLDGEGGVVRGPLPITSGTLEDPTPAGDFRVTWRNIDHVSSITGTPMPYSVFFDHRGRAFHEGSLERPSLGCIHLAHDDAVAFWNALQVGDSVKIIP